jgi:RimJ/RimL family protein N-acetyltransferase
MLTFGALNLWKIEQADLGDHYKWANNDNLRRLVGGPPRPRSSHEVEAWFRSVVNDPAKEVFSLKTPDARLVGWAELSAIDTLNGSANVGIVIDEEEWRRGYGHDALVALIRYAFEDLRLHRLGAEVLAINLPSLALFQKVGFQSEGLRREYYYTSGRFLDVEILGLLSREFTCPRPHSHQD